MQLRNNLVMRTIKKVLYKPNHHRQREVEVNVNVFFMNSADVSVNSSGNTIARTILKNKE